MMSVRLIKIRKIQEEVFAMALKKFDLSRLDPMVWFLEATLRGFLKSDLGKEELGFVRDNIQKHRKALWINLFSSALVVLGLLSTPTESIAIVITSLLAPVMILGVAWFAISFGGVPKNLMDVAMATTLWMFVAFVSSLSAMFIAVGFVTSFLLWPVLGLVYIGVLVGCIQYDTADGLKAGLNEAQLKHALLASEYLEGTLWKRGRKTGDNPEEGAAAI